MKIKKLYLVTLIGILLSGCASYQTKIDATILVDPVTGKYYEVIETYDSYHIKPIK